MEFPKWLTNVAIVGLIFTIGTYVARLEYGIKNIQERLEKIEKKFVAVETAISIHHGQDWSSKIENKTLKKVDDLETKIGSISQTFDEKVKRIGENFGSTVNNLEDIQAKVKAVHMWTQQGDVLIKKSRLEPYRVIADFRKSTSDDQNVVLINKAHRRSGNFKLEDHIILRNPQPPGREVEVIVGGYFDNPDQDTILVQITEGLVEKLDLRRELGHFELFVQGKPEALRWKTLDELYEIAKTK